MADELKRYFQLLSCLELIESKLLTWGVVDGSFTHEEVCDEFERHQADFGLDEDPRELLETLIEEGLIFEFSEQGVRRYRTRMAEAVRLFARLRQIRPWNDWQTAPTLVADFRFRVAPRLYPSRVITPEQVVARVRERTTLSSVGFEALAAMLRLGKENCFTLAEFQVQATVQTLADASARGSRGVIVTAGTGTGKTKAFYLPALASVAQWVQPKSYWTKVLALYPRKELLKDQYSETYSEVLLLNESLQQILARRITIGVLFGDTPSSATLNHLDGWKSAGHYRCSSLRCPRCQGELEWKANDILNSREVLTCIDVKCGFRSHEGDLVLTRRSLEQRPPDVLFSTTEMLNRSMSHSRRAALFGVQQPNPPRIVLLDEVHTYDGTHGAQVAYLLRRWRNSVRKKMLFMGLSATLENAREFFSQLTGLRVPAILHIPGGETDPQGVEYQLALRGDPVSAAALLATTIQTCMLTRRILDPTEIAGQSRFGHRAYVFTDDLDVVNRLYYDLLDAEGQGPTNRGQTLATFRQHALPQAKARLKFGQSWKLCEDLGHNLARRLAVGRTSSQDAGVDRNADLIVATASLEVGYNDPSVGAVIQHKAPRDMASFLQRKGRAGRRPEMRPWTIISLSDYGRDRFAYETYDQLFSPRLPPRILPVNNRYILRMQAAFALMDWLALKMPANLNGSIWADLAGPASPPWTARQDWLLRFLPAVMDSTETRNELESHLKAALATSNEEVLALMWEPPRSIMMGLIPTLLRRLESKWRRVPIAPGDSPSDLLEDGTPIPDFVPANLFSDLALAEVHIAPQRQGNAVELPILQAMQTLAPGNATRRFTPHHDSLQWFPPPDFEHEEQDMPVDTWCVNYEHLGEYQALRNGTVVSIPCVRPLKFTPSVVPKNVRPTSKGFLEWYSQLFANGQGNIQKIPQNSSWFCLIDHLEFFTHASNSHVTVRRFCLGARANITFARKSDNERTFSLTFRREKNGPLMGVGFTQDVDGIAIRFRYPSDLHVDLDDLNQEKIRSFRTAFFHHSVRNDPLLQQHANNFQLDWLYQMYLSALSAEALQNVVSLPKAHESLIQRGLPHAMMEVLEVIFQTIRFEEEDEESKAEQKTKKRLDALVHRPEVISRLSELAGVLWKQPGVDWESWARERFRATLGMALLEAIQRCSPQVDVDALWLDLTSGVRAEGTETGEFEEIWITERSLGGTGVVEEVLKNFAEDPSRFLRLVQEALGASDFELVDIELSRLAKRSQEPSLRQALGDVREAVTNEQLRDRVGNLRRVLQREGFVVSHAVMAALQARILRPGTDEGFDVELTAILDDWHAEEERLGIEIDLRAIAYVFGRNRQLSEILSFLPDANLQDPQWRYQAYASILWPRGNTVRNRSLAWQPFAQFPPIDRFLVLDCLKAERIAIDVSDPCALQKIRLALADTAIATLTGPVDQPSPMRQAIVSLVSEPFEVGFLHVYPQVEGVYRCDKQLEVRFICREAIR